MKLKIGRAKFDVVRKTGLKVKHTVDFDEQASDDDVKPEDFLYGCMNMGQGKIYLETKMVAPWERVTAMHEALHALMYLTPLKVAYNHEEICCALAPVLVDFISDNPEFIEYLKDESIVIPEEKELNEDGH